MHKGKTSSGTFGEAESPIFLIFEQINGKLCTENLFLWGGSPILKKPVSLILAVFLLLTCSLPAFAFIGEVTFTDPESGAQFTILPGWNQEQANDDGSVFFSYLDDDGNVLGSIVYYSSDLMASLGDTSSGYDRDTLDMRNYSALMSEWKEMASYAAGVPASDITDLRFGTLLYMRAPFPNELVNLSSDKEAFMLVGIYNGFLHGFLYFFDVNAKNADGKPIQEDIESVFASAQYPGNPASVTNSLIPSLLLFCGIFLLPLILYRFAIRRRPLSPGVGFAVSLLWGALVCGIAVLAADGVKISIGGIWLLLGELVLSVGYKKPAAEENPVQQTAAGQDVPAQDPERAEDISADDPAVSEDTAKSV